MTLSRRSPSHLDLPTVLDYLDQRLDASRRRAVDEHLGKPCADCRERVRVLGELVETMRADRTGEVPAWLHERARAVFAPTPAARGARKVFEALAELLFDSFVSPQPAMARRSVGEARRLRYRFEEQTLDLEIEREGTSTLAVRGRLTALDPALWTLDVQAVGEHRTARPDARGSFSLENVPSGALEMRLVGPSGTFRLPSIEP